MFLQQSLEGRLPNWEEVAHNLVAAVDIQCAIAPLVTSSRTEEVRLALERALHDIAASTLTGPMTKMWGRLKCITTPESGKISRRGGLTNCSSERMATGLSLERP